MSKKRYSHTSASLRFFFEEARDLEWKPISELEMRMLDDMKLHGLAVQTQQSYEKSVTELARYYNRTPELYTILPAPRSPP